jgi:hypothetical protein
MKQTVLEKVEERLREAEEVTWGPFSKLRDALIVEEKTIVHNAAEAAGQLGMIISSRSSHFTGACRTQITGRKAGQVKKQGRKLASRVHPA